MNGIDAHCHIEYMDASVLDEAAKRISALVTSVANPADAEKTLAVATRHENFVFVALGMHPDHAIETNDKTLTQYIDLIKKNKNRIVAIGEVGLDYHHMTDEKEKERSKDVFLHFIALANELHLPLVIHSRNAMNDTFEFLRHAQVPVMMHCFDGNAEHLQEALRRNYYISFTAMIVRSEKYQKIAKRTPLENMLLETDAPWLDPENPGELMNRPWNIIKSAQTIAKIKSLTTEDVLQQTEKNTRKLFRLFEQQK
ncbi:MAG: TatD family hydrolase [Candidatus Aenigmarchaeota archaeon]|nr:TatD family hydrolase [Candidatus Aenigmarchaeota archaeon]